MATLGNKTATGLVCALALIGASARAAADDDHNIDLFVAGDVWPQPEGGGHGIVYAGWRWRAPVGRVHASYNTDTLTLGIDDICWDGRLCLGARVRGQLGFAGLLPDYYERGLRRPEFGISASYAAGTVLGQYRPATGWFIDLASTARRWFFATTGDTEGYALPAETWVFEQQLNLTGWSFAADPSTSDPHRPTWRLRGVGFGLQANYHRRLDADEWGATASDPARRNRPDRDLFFVRQWAAAGVPLARWLRLQLFERAGYGWGEDDLTRARIGGLNPYVVPIAGVPWAGFIAGRYVAGQLTLHFVVSDSVEVGPQLDVAGIRDVLRRGDDDLGLVMGVGGFVDVQWGAWQGELRAGYSPDVGGWQASTPHLSVYGLLGRTFAF